MLRLADGANLHWAAGSKTVWFDGKPNARRTLATLVACILHELGDEDQPDRGGGRSSACHARPCGS